VGRLGGQIAAGRALPLGFDEKVQSLHDYFIGIGF
jgi:hypothetical protein